MKRFYPDTVPPFAYEPTGERFEVRTIDDRNGQGAVALVPFEPGEIVFRFTGFATSEITQFTLQYSKDLHLHDPFFMGKVLHSCEPNMSCDMVTRTFTALRRIEAGECITMDYEQTEDILFKPFDCACGAPACRHHIAGRLLVPTPIPTSQG